MPGTWPTVGRRDEQEILLAALGDATTRCLVLSGEAGVGKTRLAHEITGRLRRERRRVHWTVATQDTQQIPLGALAALLADDPGHGGPAGADRFGLLMHAQHVIGTHEARELIVIDDAPLLDDLGAALAQQLVASGAGPRLLLTARTDSMPEWLVRLARDDLCEHVRLAPLGESAVAQLVDVALSGTVDPRTHAALWSQSVGNPLWLRLLVRDGLETGALAERGGVWTWAGPPQASSLAGMLAARLTGLPASERDVLELLAYAEPLSPQVVARLGLEAALMALERRELVTTDPSGDVRTAHPLLGGLLRDGLAGERQRTVRQTLISAFRAAGPPRGTDALRVARWQLESGDRSDPELMVLASRRALALDPVLAERFADAALAAGPDAAGQYALARALLDQARLDESAQAYADLLAGPLPPERRAEAMMDSAYFALWVHHDAAAGMAQLREVEAASPRFAAQAASLRAAIALFSGATAEAIDAGLPVAQHPNVAADVLHLAAVAVVPALTVAGRVGEAVELAERTRQARGEFVAEQPGAIVGPTYRDAQLGWEYAQALRWSGRIDDAVADAAQHLRESAAQPVRHPESYGLRNAALGSVHLAAGAVRAALPALRVGASVLRTADQVGTLVSALADLACAEALAGEPAAAEMLLAEAGRRRHPAVHVFEADLARARAVVTACSGDLRRAREEAADAADIARRWGQPLLQAAGLHLAACFGAASEAAPALSEIAASTGAGYVAVLARHAHACGSADPAALSATADEFAAAGARLHAAFTSARAARLYRAGGRDAEATRAARHSRAWSARCPGAPRPRLHVEPEPLTPREREIVSLARAGRSNAEISKALVISGRTVENHLQHAFAKLGVSARTELGTVPLS